MFGEKAFELIKELDRNPDNLPPFNVSTQTHVAIAIFTLLVNGSLIVLCAILRMKLCVKCWMK